VLNGKVFVSFGSKQRAPVKRDGLYKYKYLFEVPYCSTQILSFRVNISFVFGCRRKHDMHETETPICGLSYYLGC
jgi:hypothetical protein